MPFMLCLVTPLYQLVIAQLSIVRCQYVLSKFDRAVTRIRWQQCGVTVRQVLLLYEQQEDLDCVSWSAFWITVATYSRIACMRLSGRRNRRWLEVATVHSWHPASGQILTHGQLTLLHWVSITICWDILQSIVLLCPAARASPGTRTNHRINGPVICHPVPTLRRGTAKWAGLLH